MHRDPVRHALVTSTNSPASGSELAGRSLDVTIALVGLIAFAPMMLLTAFAVAIEGKGSVIFRHTRIGRHGARFKVYKFRTMCVEADRVLQQHLENSEDARAEWDLNQKLRHDPRVSKLGNLLRKSSLDELPQLWNVLRGDMAIVGPRPIVEAEIPRYGDCFDAYCAVRPGITGVWQVSGRNDISYQRRVEMDAIYARKKSVLLDLRIIAATVPALLTRRGSY